MVRVDGVAAQRSDTNMCGERRAAWQVSACEMENCFLLLEHAEFLPFVGATSLAAKGPRDH